MQPRITRRIGDSGRSLTIQIEAATLADAMAEAIEEAIETDPPWVPWRIAGGRRARGERAQVKLTCLTREEVARLKANRGQKARMGEE